MVIPEALPADVAVPDCGAVGGEEAKPHLRLDVGATGRVSSVARFDAKITIRNIRVDACVVHTEWLREEIAP